MDFNNILRHAIEEATKWEKQMTEDERTNMTLSEARNNVIDRIFKKHRVAEIVNKEKSTIKFCDCKNKFSTIMCDGNCQH